MKSRLYSTLIPILALAVLGLIAMSFINSYAALERAAVQAKTPWPQGWPFTVDGFLLVMGGFVLVMMFENRDKPAWVPRVLAFAVSIVSGLFSASAAPPDWGSRAINAWPAFAAIFAFEGLVRLLYGRTKTPETATAPELSPPVPVAVAPTAAAVEAGPISHESPRPRPAAPLPNKHVVALRRAFQTGGPDAVEQERAKRGIDPELVPARWNGRHG